MPITSEQLNVWGETATYEVTADAIAAYADAVNDPNPAYRGSEAVAPPLFAIVPGWQGLAGAMAQVLTPEMMMMLVHQIQDQRIIRPIKAGDVITSRGRITGVRSNEKGTQIVGQVEYSAGDERIGEFYGTIFVRGHSGESDIGDAPPSVELEKIGDPVAEVTAKIDDDQTFRYAEASGDHNPIHLDEEFAKSVGLPGIINHGMNTLAQAAAGAVASVAGADPLKVKRFAGRFTVPVTPGVELTTKIWKTGTEGTFAFESWGPNAPAVKDGVIELG